MKPSARIDAVVEILTIWGKAPVPIDNIVRDYMHPRRYIGSKDRADIVERVYRIMRHYGRYGWWIETHSGQDTPRIRVITDMVEQGEYPKDIFIGGKHVPDILTPEEETYMNALLAVDMKAVSYPPSVAVECPPWAKEKLEGLFKDKFGHEMSAMLTAAPLDLRVNTILTDIDGALKSLGKDGIIAERTPLAPHGIRVKGKAFMHTTKAFQKGLVEIQDEGSQLIASMTDVKPGMRVLDFCAGGGGKTLALAAMMQNKGNIVAMDNNTRRLEKGKPRFRKAGIHNVETRSLEDEQSRKWLRRQKDAMDVVLIDAPCSSSGTWRRNPDLRWRTYGPSLEDIIKLQAEILDKVADKVKVGGRLVYATCSLFREENEEQISAFISRHPEYAVLPVKQAWFNAPSDIAAGDFMRLSPLSHQTDGFFCAVLIKKTA